MNLSDLRLVDQIYAAAQDPALLLPACKAVALRCGGFAAHHLTVDILYAKVLDTQVSDGTLAGAEADYVNYFVHIDPRIPFYVSGSLGEWRSDQFHFDERYVQRSEIYNDFLRPVGAKRMSVCMLRSQGSERTVLSIARAHDAGGFQDAELKRLQLFSSHLVRAAELRQRLKQADLAQQAAQGALERLPYGIAWLDAGSRIVWISPSAESLLAAADGLGIQASRLRCADPQLDRQLCTAVQRATRALPGREGSWFQIPRRRQPTPWLLSILPGALPSSGRDAPHALAIIQDGNGPALPHVLQLQHFYGLTPAEARLALGLLNNDTLAEYAARQHLSLATVKTHLRNLFAKTGTHRQAELLRRIALPLGSPKLP